MGRSIMDNTGPGRVAKPAKVRKILGYTPEVREVRQAEDEVNRMSSRLLDAMGISGTPSDLPAAAGPCEAVDPDFTIYYTVDHPWALWEADADDFDTAMENLRSRLPCLGLAHHQRRAPAQYVPQPGDQGGTHFLRASRGHQGAEETLW
ncbi:hypothetical protein [Streptomyces albus]|uniref:hypothetical protein n=1 Tax=Streptomyces sp. NRRL F-5917 TaxID=1463873 RepID=UPI0013311E89|nr:hypothetical protein [Streptomyces sp. NRRL F-5917]